MQDGAVTRPSRLKKGLVIFGNLNSSSASRDVVPAHERKVIALIVKARALYMFPATLFVSPEAQKKTLFLSLAFIFF